MNPPVAFDKVQEPSDVECVVVEPGNIFSKLILFQLEKQNARAASADQSHVVDQEHLPEVFVEYLFINVRRFVLVLWVGDVVHWNPKTLTLPVERVNFVLVRVVKASVREIFVVRVQLHLGMTSYLSLLRPVEEMMMHQSSIMEEIDENTFLTDDSTGNERVWEVLDWHGVVVNAQMLIHVELLSFDLFLCASLCAECSYFEDSVIEVCSTIEISAWSLFNFFKFDVRIVFTTQLFFKSQFVGLK